MACCCCASEVGNWGEAFAREAPGTELFHPAREGLEAEEMDREPAGTGRVGGAPTVYYIFGPPELAPLEGYFEDDMLSKALLVKDADRKTSTVQSVAIRRAIGNGEGLVVEGIAEKVSPVEYFIKREYTDATLFKGEDANGPVVANMHTTGRTCSPFRKAAVTTPNPNWRNQKATSLGHRLGRTSNGFLYAQASNDHWIPHTSSNEDSLAKLNAFPPLDLVYAAKRKAHEEHLDELCRYDVVTANGCGDPYAFKATVVLGSEKTGFEKVVAKAQGFGLDDTALRRQSYNDSPGWFRKGKPAPEADAWNRNGAQHIRVEVAAGCDDGALLLLVVQKYILGETYTPSSNNGHSP
ncbi:hypothetical protein M885DRAFT_516989 [Pelagophyceae sp. CCMP2097]|nr:hypothetical protein M885DRAFT_516989 [Pelagophyceae sp. CCMP2097]